MKPGKNLAKGIELAHPAWVLQHLVCKHEGTFVRKTASDTKKVAAMLEIARLKDSDPKRRAYIYRALGIPDGTDDLTQEQNSKAATYASALDDCIARLVDLNDKYTKKVRRVLDLG